VSSSPIFIVGMPRSGTTLLSSLISAHPRIAITPETHFLNRFVRTRRDARQPAEVLALWAEFRASDRFKFLELDATAVEARIRAVGPTSYRDIFDAVLACVADRDGKVRTGEKTPPHYARLDTLLEWYPDARILFMLRDPRAVVASLRQTPWGKKYGVDLHAMRWRHSGSVLHIWQADPRLLIIRYERLVTEPADVVRAACSFVGEEFYGEMLTAKRERHDFENRTGWAKTHFARAVGAISSDGVDKWRTQLSAKEVSIIEHYSSPYMGEFKYEMLGEAIPRYDLLAALVRRNLQRLRRRTNFA
jgi:hypothetical protein